MYRYIGYCKMCNKYISVKKEHKRCYRCGMDLSIIKEKLSIDN